MLNCNCMTFNCDRNETVVGSCLYTCGILQSNRSYFYFYNLLPDSFIGLGQVCREMNRDGVLCGRCLPNHYPLVYSFNMSCVQCPNVRWNWVKYIAGAYLPLTLFYLIILFFNINVLSSHLFSIVTVFQIIALPAMVRILLKDFEYNTSSSYLVLAKFVISFCGIWNLDFFRPFYSELCLGISTLPTLALDYGIAVYPLFLMLATYLLIELYDRKYRVVTIMWSPFQRVFSLFRRKWEIRTSIIDAYATFFLLSNTKFLNVSFDLLAPTKVYKLKPDYYDYFLGLYYSQDIYFFKNSHRFYGVLAIVVLIIFVLFPLTILTLYPLKFFHRQLNRLPFRWHVLHTFMDSFIGCYKDGTQPGTRDYRWFAALQFHIPLLFFAVYSVATNVLLFLFMSMTLMGLALLVMTLRPYRSSVDRNNTTLATFFLLLALLFLIPPSLDLSAIYMRHLEPFLYGLASLIIIATMLYSVGLVACWIYQRRRFGQEIKRRIKEWRQPGYQELAAPLTISRASSYEDANDAGEREGYEPVS